MKVFFHAYLRDQKNYLEIYHKIYQAIGELGFAHVNDFFAKVNPKKSPVLPDYDDDKKRNIYAVFSRDIKMADIMVAEISMYSLASGVLIDEAINQEKPVIALYLEGNKPYHLVKAQYEKLQYVEYNPRNLSERLKTALKLAKEQVDIRFNFIISPQIIRYLNWLSAENSISKSTYLRDLIVKDMKKNKEYSRINKKTKII